MATVAKKESLREQYYAGKISADEFLKRLFDSKDGDRKRKRIEKKFDSIVSKYGKKKE
ncbi:hypothetical protein [Aneurinibacillus thermoaerophilus]|uniref:hypothetical protein n=1 Tax=Aneurinibacillus thermoaerophilus TaxID=143495 RepID=UPI002E1FED64|nr:hypothetical protein [Aneurinibacillus thermoaerophilus]MED0738632.1 hypothetical protein [Aneurinibacillus thermoaerophilus]MED0763222.1 hypothetical protein [Aneurinibacillus thermoaerophilus]